MCLGEHIHDLLAGTDIPFRHIILPHQLFPAFPFIAFAFGDLTFTHILHDVESVFVGNAPIDERRHDRVTAADNGVKVTYALLDQILCIACPYVGTVRQTHELDEIVKPRRLRLCDHSARHRCSEF